MIFPFLTIAIIALWKLQYLYPRLQNCLTTLVFGGFVVVLIVEHPKFYIKNNDSISLNNFKHNLLNTSCLLSWIDVQCALDIIMIIGLPNCITSILVAIFHIVWLWSYIFRNITWTCQFWKFILVTLTLSFPYKTLLNEINKTV